MRRDVGIYRSCAVYAGAVDYVFEVNGRPVMVRVSKVEQEPQPRVPANLVEPVTDKLEGPPGANKALVGKRFYLYSINERVLSVVPVEKE